MQPVPQPSSALGRTLRLAAAVLIGAASSAALAATEPSHPATGTSAGDHPVTKPPKSEPPKAPKTEPPKPPKTEPPKPPKTEPPKKSGSEDAAKARARMEQACAQAMTDMQKAADATVRAMYYAVKAFYLACNAHAAGMTDDQIGSMADQARAHVAAAAAEGTAALGSLRDKTVACLTKVGAPQQMLDRLKSQADECVARIRRNAEQAGHILDGLQVRACKANDGGSETHTGEGSGGTTEQAGSEPPHD